jgi:hypothetical protein
LFGPGRRHRISSSGALLTTPPFLLTAPPFSLTAPPQVYLSVIST